MLDGGDHGVAAACAVLEPVAAAHHQGLVDHPTQIGDDVLGDHGWHRRVRHHQHIAAGDIDVVGQLHHHRVAGFGGRHDGAPPMHRGDRGGAPTGQDGDGVAGRQGAGGHHARVAAEVGLRPSLRADHALHVHASTRQCGRRGIELFEQLEQWRAHVPRHVPRAVDHVVAQQCRHGDRGDRQLLGQRADERAHVARDAQELILGPTHQIHLVDRHDDRLDTQQRRDQRVSAGLVDDTVAGVHQHDRNVGRRGAGDHVARVLRVAGRVGNDEAARRCGEVAVRHIDGDALLALGAQAVGEQGEVGRPVAISATGLHDRLQLILEDGLRVVQQTSDERALAVVDGAGGGDAQRGPCRDGGGAHQK